MVFSDIYIFFLIYTVFFFFSFSMKTAKEDNVGQNNLRDKSDAELLLYKLLF